MSAKISAMTPATEMFLADVLPIVQAGANLKATKQQILDAATAEATRMNSSASTFFELQTDGSFYFKESGTMRFAYDVPGGAFAVNAVSFFQLTSAGTSQIATAAGILTLQSNPGFNVVIVYVPAAPGNWVIPPVDLVAAVDRLAAAVAGLLGGPIP